MDNPKEKGYILVMLDALSKMQQALMHREDGNMQVGILMSTEVRVSQKKGGNCQGSIEVC